MADFKYKSKDIQGELHEGQIESSDEHSALLVLRKRGLIVISISELAEKKGSFLDRILKRVSFGEVVNITRQLATMVGAGLPLSESVDILEEQQENKKLKEALNEISRDIKGGLTLAVALSKHTDIFDPLYINLVKAGETSGKLDEILLKMADSLEKDREFRARIKGAMIYPIVVLTLMFIVITIMMVFVIPKLTSLYKDSNLELPLPTKILVGVSTVVSNFWYIFLVLIIIGIIFYRRWYATETGKLKIDRLLLKVPLLGKITTNVTLTNFNRIFGLLMAAGIPLLEAINIVKDVTSNSVFKKSLNECYSGVEKGLTFSSQIVVLPIFPRIVGQMIRVGEETGKLDEIFLKLADFFESESDHMVKNLTTAIEPLVIVILGLGVGFVVISIFLPILKLTTSF